MMSFGQKIKKLRRGNGWTQDNLGKKVGVHGRHIGKYEIGKAMPNTETLTSLSRVLEVSIDYLLLEKKELSPAIRIGDESLLEAFEYLDQLKSRDKEIIKVLIDAFIKKQKIEELLQV